MAFQLAILAAISGSAFGQITATWYDINPSQSNDSSNGGSSGRVNHVGAASDLSKVYAATEWGGLYQSFDQGNTWVKINTFSPSATWDVKVDPTNSQLVYATSFYDGRVNPQSGISVSNNAGATWTAVSVLKLNTLTCGTNGVAIPQRITQPSAWQIAINPNNTKTVFVGTSCGLARSLDSGGSWTFIDPSPSDGLAEQVYAVLAQGRETVDVITDNGHFRSTNNGGSWSAIPSAPGPVAGNTGPGSSIAASPAESYVLLAADTAGNIFEADNGGTTWPTSLTLPLLPGGLSDVQGRIPFVKTNQTSTSNQFDVWYGDINLFKTTATTPPNPAQGGSPRTPLNSWSNEQDGGHWDVGDVLFNPRFAAGACPSFYTADGGVYRNTNPNNPGCQSPSWQQPTITPHATWVWSFDGVRRSPGQHNLVYGLQDNGGYAATNAAEGHNPPPANWNNYICCDVMDNTEGAGQILSLEGFYSGARAFQLTIRNQDGSNGNQIPNYPSAQGMPAFINGREDAPFGSTGYVVNLQDGVYFTNNILNNPIGWTALNAPTAATSSAGNVKIANLGGKPNVFYHTGNGDPESQGVIFRSTLVGSIRSPGSNWVQMPLPPNIGSVTAYDIDPTDGNHAIVSGINNISNNFEIWITPNFGANWTHLTNLENLMLQSGPAGGGVFINQASQGRTTGFLSFGTYWQPSLFKFDPLDPTTIVAGAIDAGVFISVNNGSNWQLVSTPVNPTSTSPNVTSPVFAYFSPGRFTASSTAFDVWVGTRGSGIRKVVLETPSR